MVKGLGKESGEPSAYAQDAADTFVQRAYGDWCAEDEARLNHRLATDPDFERAFRGVGWSWQSTATHAEAPEIMAIRESAIGWIRHENMNRWQGQRKRILRPKWGIAAAVIAVAIAVGVMLQPFLHPNSYATAIGEHRQVILADHSVAEMDAATKLLVEYSDHSRTVRLLEGQAQFSVAKDTRRPFVVWAGDRAVVALGTVFTVEYVDQMMHVTTVEGKVAVMPATPGLEEYPPLTVNVAGKTGTPVQAGEEWRSGQEGTASVARKVDIAAATAWLKGSVVFRDEPIGEAAHRMNRYSRLQLRITDPELASLRISGVFQRGDTAGFARSVEGYYPVEEVRTDSHTLTLHFR